MAKVTEETRYHWVNLRPAEKLLAQRTGYSMSWLVEFTNEIVLEGMLSICRDYLRLKAKEDK